MMWPQPFSRILIWPAHNKPCRTQMCFFWTLRYYKCRDFSFLQLLYELPDYGFVWPSTSTWNIRWFSSFKVKLWVNPNPTVLLFYRAAFLKIEITSYFPPKFSNPHEYCGVSPELCPIQVETSWTPEYQSNRKRIHSVSILLVWCRPSVRKDSAVQFVSKHWR